MSELMTVVKEIIQETADGMKLADIAVGTVVSTSPLSIQIDISMPPIPEQALILTDSVRARSAPVTGGQGGTVQIHSGLAAGDKALMLRVSKGQRFIVLSKM